MIDLIDSNGTLLYSNNHPELVLKAIHPQLSVVNNYLHQEKQLTPRRKAYIWLRHAWRPKSDHTKNKKRKFKECKEIV